MVQEHHQLSHMKKTIPQKKIEKFIIKETETDVIPEKKSPTFFAKWFKLSTKSQKNRIKVEHRQ